MESEQGGLQDKRLPKGNEHPNKEQEEDQGKGFGLIGDVARAGEETEGSM